MKLLVTGCEGSLMQAVIPLLQDNGHQIVGVDSFVRYGEIDRPRNYEFIRGDLTDIGFCRGLMNGVEGVVQAAALIYGVGGFHKYAADILSKDITLHQNILWAMRDSKVKRIVYISSSMVYERCRTHPSTEESADESLIPSTEYGLSKLVCERLTRAFAQQYGLEYSIWRPFNIITPYEKGEQKQGLSHVFADFIRKIVVEQNSVLPIIGDGEQIRCFTWIGDVARGIADHSFTGPAKNETFNLGNPEPITMKELANLIYRTAQELGSLPKSKQPLQFRTTMSFKKDVRKRIPDIKKAQTRLGWQPTLRIKDSVKQCVQVPFIIT